MSELNPHAANLLKAEYGHTVRMTEKLNPHAANLLKAEYGHTVRMTENPSAPASVSAPSADLIHQLEGTAQSDFGIPVAAVADWTTWITSLVTAIAAQNWLALIPLVLQLGSYIPQAWAFIQSIIRLLHGPGVLPTPTGPVITGS